MQLLPRQTASDMTVILKGSCCLYQNSQRVDSNSLFDLFSYSTALLSFLACIVSVKKPFTCVGNDQPKWLTEETMSEEESVFS